MFFPAVLFAFFTIASSISDSIPYKVQKPPLDTDWTYQVGTNPWPEHPRPQLQRSQWQSLNGIWTYEDAGSLDAVNDPPFNKSLHAEVLVPSCLESGLSGIQGNDTLYSWFQTTFEIPSNWTGNRVLLNFAAVDYEATVFVNGVQVAFHRGGYFTFTVDITDNLIVGPNSLGIWQSVWIESVPAVYISNLDITGDMYGNVNVTVSSESHQEVSISVIERGSGDVIGTGIGSTNEYFSFAVHSPKLWSPDSPTLYDVIVTLDEDTVQSYTGFRSITRQVVDGVQRPLLNGEFHFLFGTLDQGFWPDGLYVPPNREAMEYDIKTLKSLGMNMLRKHASLPPTSICSYSAKNAQQIKVESALYYQSCDELGILVMQDMPCLRPQDNPTPSPAQQDEFNRQLALMVTQLRSHPSIFAWTIYNEGWGQLNDSASQPALDRDLTATLHSLDPTRLVDTVSGWHDHGAGDLRDNHNYPHPMCGVPHTAPSPSGPNDPSRIGFQGEFGGLGQNLSLAHLWDVGQAIADVTATYRLYETTEAWNQASLDLIGELGRQAARSSCSGGVWTQTTDVEGEVNGVLSYDRRILRADVRRWREGIGALDRRTE
ncbi:hydrolase family 2 [Teratosphaeria destructans]|uniref:Hydrolase family 2 n=1 Tax=Teratosphaeria destructans TaxID=418781 RepID=A0A9W7SYR9_9PEZI|nr:hydrolase family 2 [Teratosphaeria destructans]